MSETKKQERRRLAYIILSGMVILGGLFWFGRSLSRSAPITDPSYYTGPKRNHNGDLVSPDGTILEKGAARPRRRGGTPALD
jgi:hypothetical protein